MIPDSPPGMREDNAFEVITRALSLLESKTYMCARCYTFLTTSLRLWKVIRMSAYKMGITKCVRFTAGSAPCSAPPERVVRVGPAVHASSQISGQEVPRV
jgi:hypothetical protein